MSEGAKVVTEHEEAAKAIESLRGVAQSLKRIGDELVQSKGLVDEWRGKVETLEREVSEVAADQVTLESWGDLLEDFRRGIVDRDELLERTVGKE